MDLIDQSNPVNSSAYTRQNRVIDLISPPLSLDRLKLLLAPKLEPVLMFQDALGDRLAQIWIPLYPLLASNPPGQIWHNL
jgi:hypothetical protein